MQATVLALVFAMTAVGGFFPVSVPGAPQRPQLSAASLPVSMPGLPASAPTVSVSSASAQFVPLTVVAPSVRQVPVTPAPSIAVSRTLSTTAEGATALGREAAKTPIFYRHVVEEGQNVSSIAKQYGVDREHVIWNNIELQDNEDLLEPGQKLQIPALKGVIHSVRLGETLTEIAEHYDARVVDIINFPANNIPNANAVVENVPILVPGGRVIPRPAPTLRPEPPAPAAASGAPAAQPASSGWIWPVNGLLTSRFGPSHPLGIDINAPYVPVAAAQGGTVVFVGGDRCCSYGLYIELQHPGGYSTRYAHLSQFSVSLGQVVNQGQVIGVSGNTGRSTGPHLHFELRRNGQIVNPLSFLP